MHPALAIAAFVAATALIAAALIALARRPMTELLRSNSYLAPGAAFYVRSFTLIIALGALATMAGLSLPCPKQSAEMAPMEWAWWLAGRLEPVFLTGALFLLGYVLLLTILFAVLGRYRDQ
jgi:hypothetical protein